MNVPLPTTTSGYPAKINAAKSNANRAGLNQFSARPTEWLLWPSPCVRFIGANLQATTLEARRGACVAKLSLLVRGHSRLHLRRASGSASSPCVSQFIRATLGRSRNHDDVRLSRLGDCWTCCCTDTDRRVHNSAAFLLCRVRRRCQVTASLLDGLILNLAKAAVLVYQPPDD